MKVDSDEGTATMEILRMNPVFKETIWGGRRLHDDFGYDTPSDHTGECWAVSAHPDGEGSVCGETYDGTPLSVLWKEHPELFGNLPLDRFPLLTKIIDANGDLSIQVHATLSQTEPFMIGSVISGSASLDGETFKKGDHFIIPCGYPEIVLEGKAEFIFSAPSMG